ncbi:MAG: hypothetical protein A2Y62_04060 [Candidatus Fischerbacteria bacterium RBG_13_37_8]|uniref:PatA-like N-terminal domain-containing protein n=1 Tax=Candidatus Fischerbacteria bacterium RBG_13_37_8 TaxID=1817863 RepID=A0A1F5V553_9BACT|nr:MAG: hypothetical protein A2Y62_04060 [Candidatus Fischerbacteria bacterium RBG_13_37_8]
MNSAGELKKFKGNLSILSLPDILEFLNTSAKTGLLALKRASEKKELYLKNGNVVFASSNLNEDRLGDLMLREGKITKEQFDKSVELMAGRSKRQGKILIEIGAIEPKDLWLWIHQQIKKIVYSVFEWSEGEFYFSEGDLPSQENITADVGIPELVMEGIRNIKHYETVAKRFPTNDIIFTQTTKIPPLELEPHEKHILAFVDGQKSVDDICMISEIGINETLKVLYMLLTIDLIFIKGRKSLPPIINLPLTQKKAIGIIRNYNKLFAFLYRYMYREVGPIVEYVLRKYIGEYCDKEENIIASLEMQEDGTFQEDTIYNNITNKYGTVNQEKLHKNLEEILYAEVLAVKKTLGVDHEKVVVDTLKITQSSL